MRSKSCGEIYELRIKQPPNDARLSTLGALPVPALASLGGVDFLRGYF